MEIGSRLQVLNDRQYARKGAYAVTSIQEVGENIQTLTICPIDKGEKQIPYVVNAYEVLKDIEYGYTVEKPPTARLCLGNATCPMTELNDSICCSDCEEIDGCEFKCCYLPKGDNVPQVTKCTKGYQYYKNPKEGK